MVQWRHLLGQPGERGDEAASNIRERRGGEEDWKRVREERKREG